MTTTSKSTRNGQRVSSALTNPLLKLIALGSFALVTGCSSLVNIGASDFNCPSPDGVQCKSSREIYEMTHDGNVPDPELGKKGKKARKKTDVESVQTNDTKGGEAASTNHEKAEPDSVVDNYVAPRLSDRPVPIRTPAHVMRIWVAPWEDTNGDLITNGYVYTEIEPRRWVIGKPEGQGAPTLRPLQSIQSVSGSQ